MITTFTKWSVTIYAIFLIVAGVVRYLMEDSTHALIMGAATGILFLVCAGLMFAGKRIGLILATLLMVLMTGLFTSRYWITKANFPALISVLSGAMLVFLLLNLARWKKR